MLYILTLPLLFILLLCIEEKYISKGVTNDHTFSLIVFKLTKKCALPEL